MQNRRKKKCFLIYNKPKPVILIEAHGNLRNFRNGFSLFFFRLINPPKQSENSRKQGRISLFWECS